MRIAGLFMDLVFVLLLLILMICSGAVYLIIKSARFNPVRFLLLMIFLVAAAGIGGRCYYQYLKGLSVKPDASMEPQVLLEIESGSNLKQIAGMLEKEGLVRNGDQLLLLARIQRVSKDLKAGSYMVSRGITQDSMLKILRAGEIATQKITVPEGLNIEQTASVMKGIGLDSVEFCALANDPSFIELLGINQKTLEGYLYPSTYFFPLKITARQVIEKMVNTALKTFGGLEQLPLVRSRYNLHQIFTMASIVEEEASVRHEMPRIAGVFYNRLHRSAAKGGPMPLGADPTVRYALKKYTGSLTRSNLRVDSPYNTRVRTGLPPGPICSPGREALHASTNPEEHPYYYFVAKYDGSREHYFTKTNADHVRMKKLSKRNKLF